ncbi:L-arabinose transport system permease protein AraQ [Cutibacterium acnes JCM 18916]|nr:L-arabinose transport system permease protein AraQ [Cutibacterium acnes JCM 18916]
MTSTALPDEVRGDATVPGGTWLTPLNVAGVARRPSRL